jgi:hypothetical protein
MRRAAPRWGPLLVALALALVGAAAPALADAPFGVRVRCTGRSTGCTRLCLPRAAARSGRRRRQAVSNVKVCFRRRQQRHVPSTRGGAAGPPPERTRCRVQCPAPRRAQVRLSLAAEPALFGAVIWNKRDGGTVTGVMRVCRRAVRRPRPRVGAPSVALHSVRRAQRARQHAFAACLTRRRARTGRGAARLRAFLAVIGRLAPIVTGMRVCSQEAEPGGCGSFKPGPKGLKWIALVRFNDPPCEPQLQVRPPHRRRPRGRPIAPPPSRASLPAPPARSAACGVGAWSLTG